MTTSPDNDDLGLASAAPREHDAEASDADAAPETAVTSPGERVAALPDSLEDMDDAALLKVLEESRIVIRPGGEVVIENLTADLLEVAFALNPDQPGVSCEVPESGEESGDGGTP